MPVTYLFFCWLNAAEKECEIINLGFCEVLAGSIRIKAIGFGFEKSIDNGERG